VIKEVYFNQNLQNGISLPDIFWQKAFSMQIFDCDLNFLAEFPSLSSISHCLFIFSPIFDQLKSEKSLDSRSQLLKIHYQNEQRTETQEN
jgi:hypothetical protein